MTHALIVGRLTCQVEGFSERLYDIKRELEDFKTKHYALFKNQQDKIFGIRENDIRKKVNILNDYYPRVESFEQNHKIKSQAKFRSTVLEEFCGYLFKDIVLGQ